MTNTISTFYKESKTANVFFFFRILALVSFKKNDTSTYYNIDRPLPMKYDVRVHTVLTSVGEHQYSWFDFYKILG